MTFLFLRKVLRKSKSALQTFERECMIAIEHYTQADKKKSKLLISQFRNFVIIVAKRILKKQPFIFASILESFLREIGRGL